MVTNRIYSIFFALLIFRSILSRTANKPTKQRNPMVRMNKCTARVECRRPSVDDVCTRWWLTSVCGQNWLTNGCQNHFHVTHGLIVRVLRAPLDEWDGMECCWKSTRVTTKRTAKAHLTIFHFVHLTFLQRIVWCVFGVGRDKLYGADGATC